MIDTKKFHAHLDECVQCRTQPFNLCPNGQKIMEETMAGDKK